MMYATYPQRVQKKLYMCMCVDRVIDTEREGTQVINHMW